jgi:branched-chain amino acid transport system ATP-binding protein
MQSKAATSRDREVAAAAGEPKAMSVSQDLLTVDDISVTYSQAIVALHGVSLRLAPGKILAVLGANGAGKTTTLKAVANLIGAERGRVTAGRIIFDGRDVVASQPSELVRNGLVSVLEGRHVFKTLTVEENLITGSIGRGSTRAETASDLERIYGIFPKLKAKKSELAGLTSGGEQQMVAIGRALMARPRLLVLDEPSVGLAPLVVHEIFASLKHLNQTTGLSILLAEQNASIGLKFADEAAVLENGRSVLTGLAADLRKRTDIKAFYLGGGLEKSSDQAAGRPLVAAQ